MKKILLLGSTGLVGGFCLDLLVDEDEVDQILVPVRRSCVFNSGKVSVVEIDFNKPGSLDWNSIDSVICCLGTTIKKAGSQEAFKHVDYSIPVNFAEEAVKQGISCYSIVTSMGASPQSRIFYNRVKGAVEEKLSGMKFQSLQIFRPSLLLGQRNEFRLGEKIGSVVAPPIGKLLVGRYRKYRPIQAKVVAQAIVKQLLLNPDGINIFESDQIQEMIK